MSQRSRLENVSYSVGLNHFLKPDNKVYSLYFLVRVLEFSGF